MRLTLGFYCLLVSIQFIVENSYYSRLGYKPALYCDPNGYHNWGNNCPLGDLVDDYEMKDGSKFSWNNLKHKANSYVKHDARLYSTIL